MECLSVSYTMVYTPCFQDVCLNIRNQSDSFCEKSFLKAGLYCINMVLPRLITLSPSNRYHATTLTLGLMASQPKSWPCKGLPSLSKLTSAKSRNNFGCIATDL